MGKGKGVDAGDKLLVAGGQNIAEEIRDAQTASSTNILQRAVTVEVLNDLALRDDAQWEEIRLNLSNPDLLDSAPRNSIIARILTAGQDKRSDSTLLCYPFFPPHMCFPLKAGEQVWLINESPDDISNVGYWMCRIPEPDFVDDLNYTHGDRKFNTPVPAGLKEKVDSAAGTPGIPGFTNGTGEKDGFSLSEEGAYEEIYAGSIANLSFAPEPVPRFTKRAGDLVLQGSNNTLICLGEDRGWGQLSIVSGLSDSEDSNASKTEAEAERIFTGTIDVVTGRGRFLPEKITLADSAGSEPDLTAPRLIENERGFIETDKEPAVNGLAVSNRKGNPTEGDPDFINDMSRVYVSMSTDGDDMFGLTDNMPNFSPTKGGGGSSGGAVSGGGSAFTNTPIEPVKESPYVIVKSDEVRIIARYDEQHDINGSIKIIKEGYPDDTSGKGRASIIIQPDGSILIDGPRVVIASGGGDGGGGLEGGNDAGDTVAIGHNASESMVLGNTLSDFLTKFCQTAAPEVGNCGGPLVNLKKACLDLKDDIDSLKHLSTMAKLR